MSNLFASLVVGGIVVGSIATVVGIIYAVVVVARIAWTGH